MTRPSTTLSKPSAWPPVKGRPSPDGEKAGQVRARSLAGQGCASSHWRQRHAKLSGFWSSYRNHISRYSMLSRSHLEGAERPRRRSPFLRKATVAAVFGKSLPFSSTQLKLQRRTNVSPSNDAVHSSLRTPVDRGRGKTLAKRDQDRLAKHRGPLRRRDLHRSRPACGLSAWSPGQCPAFGRALVSRRGS